MKKILVMVTVMALMTALLAGCSSSKPTIGICQYGEHPSLDNCREGFLAGLEEEGLKEGRDFKLDYQNGNFDDGVCTQIARSFSSSGVDLMVGIATNAALACYAASEDNDIPVVYIAVSDPISSNLVVGNVTGTSDALPVEAQLELIRRIQPDAKTIGIIYTVSETNSVSTIADYNEKAADYGFVIESIGITTQSEVSFATDTLIGKGVDCFSNLTDNTVVSVLDSILERTNDAGIPVYGSEVEQVKGGCVASAGIDYLALGVSSGKIAAKVLRKEAEAGEIPFETIIDYKIYLNTKALTQLGLTLPEELKATAVEAGE
ncbi:MAG: ABC transporter substrate-binding protein [Eubacteriaceae bacterium]|nr:ABC transporter substrate-binding protein [Eubacteriaceae bacterium]